MNNKKTLLIVGASGSGKTYLTNKMAKKYNLITTQSRTERQPRYEGETGHIFVTPEQADKEFDRGVAKTVYCGNRYYALPEDIGDFYVIDPTGVRSIDKDILKEKFIVVYMELSEKQRIKNMIERGDNFTKIAERISNDKEDFKKFELESDEWTHKFDNECMEYWFENIVKKYLL